MYSMVGKTRSALALAAAASVVACHGGPGTPLPPQSAASLTAPLAIASVDGRNKCQFGKIHVYNGPAGAGGIVQIASDRSGNLWYGAIGINAIVKYVRRHGFTSYAIPAANAKPEGITLDSQGHVWFSEWNLPNIGRLAHGHFNQYDITTLNGAASQSVDTIVGPDKRIWFATDHAGIGARSTHGATALYSLPNNDEQPSKLTVGPDKNVWFTEFAGPNVGKITRSGAVTEYNVGGGRNNFGIAAGPDRRIWFTDSANHRIGAIKTNGSGLTYYSVGTGSPAEIAARPQDGKLYFTEWEGYIGQISTKGVVRLCAIPSGASTFVAFGIIENAVDHSMWFVDNSPNVDRIGELSLR
jgi:streptogramin lyase